MEGGRKQVTNKEIANQLRDLIDGTSNGIVLSEAVQRIADELDPPRLAPGTVVWFPLDKECGVVADNSEGVYNSDGEFIPWKDLQEGARLVDILKPGEERIKIPPVKEWPPYAEGIMAMYYGEGKHESWRRIITREEALYEAEG